MAKLRHIALTTSDPGKAAEFYKEAFDMEEVRRDAKGQVFLSDGFINLAVLHFKTEDDPDMGAHGPNFNGIHHFGFLVDDVEGYAEKLEEVGGERLTLVADPGMGGLFNNRVGDNPGPSNAEVKFRSPDGVIFDISWSVTHLF